MDHLGDYRMGSKAMSKKFCRTCGVHITNLCADLSQGEIDALSEETRGWYKGAFNMVPLNLWVLDDEFDVAELKVNRFDGFEFIKPKYVNP